MTTEEDTPRSGRTKQMPIAELVARVEEFHTGASTLYANEYGRTNDEETRMLLAHLALHEQLIANRLAEYRSQAPAEVLETWIKYVPQIPIESLLGKLNALPNNTLEETTALAAMLSDTIIQIYDAIAEATAAETARDAIADLREVELRERIRATRSAEQR